MSAAPWRWPDGESLGPRWSALWQDFAATDGAQRLRQWLESRVSAGATIVPPRPLYALELTPFDSVAVVILGQDPYHGTGQAHGLAFSVPDGVALPPSLRNVYAEIERDIGAAPPASGNLERWARQGVLLINAVLTVELEAPAGHAKRGWEQFTARVIDALAQDGASKVFLLWGGFAQRFAGAIARSGAQHLVLQANHPSPLAARRPPLPFLGCGHFSRANAFLARHGRVPVNWAA